MISRIKCLLRRWFPERSRTAAAECQPQTDYDRVRVFKGELREIILNHSEEGRKPDYNRMIKDCLSLFSKWTENKWESAILLENAFESELFRYALFLNNREFKKYSDCLKSYRIYGISVSEKINRWIPKKFVRLRIAAFMLRGKESYFFGCRLPPLPGLYTRRFLRRLFFYGKKFGGGSLLKRKADIDSLDVVVTTKCTLNCRHCAYLINYCTEPENTGKDVLIQSIKKINEAVDQINFFNILGGEPFLAPELVKAVLETVNCEKCNRIVIFTNGTITPDDRNLYELMKSCHTQVIISNYGRYSAQTNSLIEKFEYFGVDYSIEEPNNYWFSYGLSDTDSVSSKNLKTQFRRCGKVNRCLLDGKLYFCPFSAMLNKIFNQAPRSDEVVELLENTRNENIKQINRLSKRISFLSSCISCGYCRNGRSIVHRAVQDSYQTGDQHDK